MQACLLVELLTEELPPRALAKLADAFAAGVLKGLVERKLVAADAPLQRYATPRRLALTVDAVAGRAEDSIVMEKIMPVSVALDAHGQPTPALLKKLDGKGIPVSAVATFERRMDGKSETLFYAMSVPGARLDEVLADVVSEALKKLPIPKLMRWGDSEYQFVRPVHGLILLHGNNVVPGELMGHRAGRHTRGHRFMGVGAIEIADAPAYAATLLEQGKVVASFEQRRAMIAEQLTRAAAQVGGRPIDDEALLDEVTALVEHPTVYVAGFEEEFLAVPQECLILTMKANQKYFPLLDANGRLMNRFLVVSNMQVADPRNIIDGNARVVRARLSDARFFFEQDRKQPLDTRVPRLESVVYHNKLGSLRERAMRLQRLSAAIAGGLGADTAQAARAGLLAKADLVTDMVGEFPELQGIMGRYYAAHDGEASSVATAVEQHYRPRFAGDQLPQGPIACAVSLADKIDALVGFFGIGQIPTGDKDPFALRRAALGVLRILMETPLPLDVAELLSLAESGFRAGLVGGEGREAYANQLMDFLFERLKNLLRDSGHAAHVVDAVLALRPTRIDQVPAKLAAVSAFTALPEAQALAAANKRIVNILRKSDVPPGRVDVSLAMEPAEAALYAKVEALGAQIDHQLSRLEYTAALSTLAALRSQVDAFFDQVMVMADDPAVRANRLALLARLAGLMNGVADISRLELE